MAVNELTEFLKKSPPSLCSEAVSFHHVVLTHTQCPSNRSFVHFLRQPKNVRLALNSTLRELLRLWRCLCCQNKPGMPNVLNKVARLQPEQVVHSGLQVGPPLLFRNRAVSTTLPFSFSWDTLLSSAVHHQHIYLISTAKAIWGAV